MPDACPSPLPNQRESYGGGRGGAHTPPAGRLEDHERAWGPHRHRSWSENRRPGGGASRRGDHCVEGRRRHDDESGLTPVGSVNGGKEGTANGDSRGDHHWGGGGLIKIYLILCGWWGTKSSSSPPPHHRRHSGHSAPPQPGARPSPSEQTADGHIVVRKNQQTRRREDTTQGT